MSPPPASTLRLPLDVEFFLGGVRKTVRIEQDLEGRLLLLSVGDDGRYETVARITTPSGDVELAGSLTQGVVF